MPRRLWATFLACGLSTVASAQTVLRGTYETPNGVADQQNLCSASPVASYPAQWTWDPARTTLKARSALPSDKLTPRIEQHRLINGADTIVAVYSSFASAHTCNEPNNVSTRSPFTPAQLQAMAATGCGPFGNTSHVDLFRLWLPGDKFLVYPAVYTGLVNNVVIKPASDYYTGSVVPIYEPSNLTI